MLLSGVSDLDEGKHDMTGKLVVITLKGSFRGCCNKVSYAHAQKVRREMN